VQPHVQPWVGRTYGLGRISSPLAGQARVYHAVDSQAEEAAIDRVPRLQRISGDDILLAQRGVVSFQPPTREAMQRDARPCRLV